MKIRNLFVMLLLGGSLIFSGSVFTGCASWSNTGKGAAIGAGSGAALGAGIGALAGKGKGAAIGAAAVSYTHLSTNVKRATGTFSRN